ncbi:MAG: UDP-glucose 4-epimerase GalE [Planctomycetes bacterium]|nr:UDP-glucose 4-epimerase GalE [Planctomycetota bacterium]
MTDTILVTGGAGYIGSHTCVELLQAGHRVVVVDNLDNSSEEALRRAEDITGRTIEFHRIDLLDRAALDAVFARQRIDAVIHFAGHKAVGESVSQPLRYYHNNLTGTIHLLQAMQAREVRRLVFSSSATVYGDPQRVPVTEDMPLHATNPYGRTKLFIEEICRDLAIAEPGWSIALLRYFNPVGAHPSGRIGEDPKGVPNNLMPFVMQVAVGKRPHLNVWGGDYPTPDGTGVRDFIHVVDLALGHLAALDALRRLPGCTAINLGTGIGYSVLDLVKAASKAVGRDIVYRIAERRPGDIATCYSDATLAQRLLGWKATRGLDEMCADHWRWQSGNPDGFAVPAR